MSNNAVLFYNKQLNVISKKIDKYNKINKNIAFSKLFIFLFAIIFFIFYFFNKSADYFFDSIFVNYGLFVIMPLLIYVLLIIFGQKYIDLYNKYKKLYNLINDEVSFLNKNYNVFRSNNNDIDYNHNYAYDLDIFEKGSIFHSINRCTTLDGENLLKNLVLNTKRDRIDILKLQEAVKEMVHKRSLSQNISAISYSNPVSLEQFYKSFSMITIKPNKVTLIYAYISSIITVSSVILYSFSLVESFIPIFLFIYQFVVASFFFKKNNDKYSKLNQINDIINLYSVISDMINNVKFKSKLLCDIKKDILNMDTKIKKLEKINEEFEQRKSGIYYLISNGLFLRDIIVFYKINKWISQNINNIPLWNNAISYLDAINSISVFSYNNSQFIFPTINNNYIIKSENLSHPLIDSSKRVGNNIEISQIHKFLIITGANMAGKSTFIRSIGVNLVLACMGAPVCASSFEFSIIDIFSSMRSSDKLMNNTSYFQAELKRLKSLKENAEKSEKMLVLLDEILKGTNSHDKLNGSKLVLLLLIKLNIVGILATHDTALGNLEIQYPDNFTTYFFDFQINGIGEMFFDYKLKKGISNNMNATILLENILKI